MYRGRLHCEFEEFTLNVPRNQIIRSTLNDSLNRGFTRFEERSGRHGRLVSDVEALLRMLYEIDRVRVTRRLIASELRLLGRNEREYKLMLKICEMLQDPSMPRLDGVSDMEIVDWLRKQEHAIFERFVANFFILRLHGKGWDVRAQRKYEWNEREEARSGDIRLPNMYPDLVLTHETGRIVILDTKWYRSPVSERHDVESVDSSNLYQMYAYLSSQDHEGVAHRMATGILLYGQTTLGHRRLRTRIDEHPFWVETLDLMQDEWWKIEADLVALIEEAVGDG